MWIHPCVSRITNPAFYSDFYLAARPPHRNVPSYPTAAERMDLAIPRLSKTSMAGWKSALRG